MQKKLINKIKISIIKIDNNNNNNNNNNKKNNRQKTICAKIYNNKINNIT